MSDNRIPWEEVPEHIRTAIMRLERKRLHQVSLADRSAVEKSGGADNPQALRLALDPWIGSLDEELHLERFLEAEDNTCSDDGWEE